MYKATKSGTIATLLVMAAVSLGICGCGRSGKKDGGKANQTIQEVIQDKYQSLMESSHCSVIKCDLSSRTIIYVDPPKSIHKTVLTDTGWQDEQLPCPYNSIEKVFGSGNDIAYILCKKGETNELASIRVINGGLEFNRIREYVRTLDLGQADPDKLTLLCEDGDVTNIIEASVSQGTLVENILFKDVWMAWEENYFNEDTEDESISGRGNFILIGTGAAVKAKDNILSDNHEWTMNEMKVNDDRFANIFIWNQSDNAIVPLKSLIDSARERVPDGEDIISISPFSICYGNPASSRVHLISVITGKEYSQVACPLNPSNSAKVIWYDDNGTLKSINLLNDIEKAHGTFSGIDFQTSYIKLTDSGKNIKYINYSGVTLDKSQVNENKPSDNTFEWF